jgi:GcrA cell cycle regulator
MADASTDEKQPWTDDRVALLKKLWTSGLSASQIAGQLGQGVTRNAVIGKVHRLNLAGRAAPPRAKQAPPPPPRKPIREPAFPQRPPASLAMPSAGNTALKPIPRLDPQARPQYSPAPEPLRLINASDKSGRITILQLTEKTCKWPIGDPGHDDFCFCGHRPRENSPYCDYHARIAYQPAHDRQRRRA